MFNLARYAYANSKIRAMISFLIEPQVFSRLLDAKDLQGVWEILKTTGYKAIAEKTGRQETDLIETEKDLVKNDIAIFKKIILSLRPGKEREIVVLLMQKYELDELKSALRAWYKKTGYEQGVVTGSGRATFRTDFTAIASAGNFEAVLEVLAGTPYQPPLKEARSVFEKSNSLFYLEASLDIDYYRRLGSAVDRLSSSDRKIAKEILGIEIDIENFNWLVRAKKYYSLEPGLALKWFIPGGTQTAREKFSVLYSKEKAFWDGGEMPGRYSKLLESGQKEALLAERVLYGFLMQTVKKTLAGFPFTIGTVLCYLILKQRETRNLISIIYSKALGLEKEDTVPLLLPC